MRKKFQLKQHMLVPKHTKLSDKEKATLLSTYSITFRELPKISKQDAALADLEFKPGDIVKITRPSQTSGESVFYRGVIDA